MSQQVILRAINNAQPHGFHAYAAALMALYRQQVKAGQHS